MSDGGWPPGLSRQLPTLDRVHHLLGSLQTYRGQKAVKQLPVAVPRSARPEGVTQEGKLLVRMRARRRRYDCLRACHTAGHDEDDLQLTHSFSPCSADWRASDDATLVVSKRESWLFSDLNVSGGTA